MNTDLMFSSETDLWPTPQDFFDKLNDVHKFEVDVCASDDNAKCSRYFTKDDDGLSQSWQGTCWMNPPYGRQIAAWVRKAYESAQAGAKVVCLLPARTDTRWWHDYCVKGEVTFIRGRLKFGGQKNSTPFPSAVVIFYPPTPSWLQPASQKKRTVSLPPSTNLKPVASPVDLSTTYPQGHSNV